MTEGRWKFNGDTIRLNGSRLVDGQHRLLAVVKADVEIDFLLVEGLEEDVFSTIDRGKKRSSADLMAVIGEKNTIALAAALTFVARYEQGALASRRPIPPSKMEALLAQHPAIRDSVAFVENHRAGGMIEHSTLIGCHYLFRKVDRDLADLFVENLVNGVNLASDDPIYLLRERLIRNKLNSKLKLKSHYKAALVIKAWNHTRQGNKISNLRWFESGTGKGSSPEPFPVIL
jgi:hypothetical protein